MNEVRPGFGQQGQHPQQYPQQPPHPPTPPHPSQVQQTFRASVTGVLPVKQPPTSETGSLPLDDEVPFGSPPDRATPPPPAEPMTAGGAATAPAAAAPKSKIHAFSVAAATNLAQDWKRPTHNSQTGAVRVRSFHGRLSEQG